MRSVSTRSMVRRTIGYVSVIPSHPFTVQVLETQMSAHTAHVPATASPQEATAPPVAADGPTFASPQPVTGLMVGHADAPAEALADRMADSALSRLRQAVPSDDPVEAHHHTPGCGHLRRSAVATPGAAIGLAGGSLDPDASSRIEAARGGGAPLAAPVRRRMETAFGTGLGHVRVHDGAQAGQLSAAISAQAFTTGNDIFFGAGRFAPHTPDGERVLAHEIGHVLSEPGGVRRQMVRRNILTSAADAVGSFFSRKVTPEQEAAKKKADDDARAAKKSKKVEATEKKKLEKSREDGIAGRANLQAELNPAAKGGGLRTLDGGVQANGLVPTEIDESATLNQAVKKEFADALRTERELRAAQTPTAEKTREQIDAEVYHTVWFELFPRLTSVRPARETAAEALVQQVRQNRTGAQAQAVSLEDDTAGLKLGKLLSKDVEKAYDRMAHRMGELLESDPTLGEALSQEKARHEVVDSMTVKVIAQLPPKDGPLDVAAWDAARFRVAATLRQKVRDREEIEAFLTLFPEATRDDERAKLDAKGGTGEAEKGLDEKATGVLDGSKAKLGVKAVGVVSSGVSSIVGMVGKGNDKAIRKAENGGVAPVPKTANAVPALSAKADLGITGLINQSVKTDHQVKTGQRTATSTAAPISAEAKAAVGITSATGILTQLIDAAKSTFAMVTSIKTAWKTKDPYEALAASKAGASGLNSLVSVAKSSATLAKTIDASVSGGVAQVIPGLDIASSALAMVRGVAEVATAGMRQHETDRSMFEARAGTTDKVNVVVYPMMKVSQAYTKHLEKAVWGLGSNVLNFSLSIAQVASAGGFGIPAAIKAAATVVDNLHTLGHYIASKVLAAMAVRATTESSVLHLEGAAEEELKRNPGMAVDSIIIRAAQGDKVALNFLAKYRINGKPITADYVSRIKPKPVKPFNPDEPDGDASATSDDALLLKIRTVVLGAMDTKADPQTVFMDLKTKLAPASDMLQKWDDSSELARKRNDLASKGQLGGNADTSRGALWKIRTLLSTSRRDNLTRKTQAFDNAEALPAGVACAVGNVELGMDADPGPAALTAFLDSLTIKDIEAEIARRPRRNGPEWIDMLRIALKEKKEEGAPAATSPRPWVSAVPSGA